MAALKFYSYKAIDIKDARKKLDSVPSALSIMFQSLGLCCLLSLALLGLYACGAHAAPQTTGGKPWLYRENRLPQQCQNKFYDFKDNIIPSDFVVSDSGNVTVIENTLVITMNPSVDDASVGAGTTVNTGNMFFQYGSVLAKVRVTSAPGVVHSLILIANGTNPSDGRDEIDFELVGKSKDQVESNIFSNYHPLYGVNGGIHAVADSQQWHDYRIDWSADNITWYIDGHAVRTLLPTFNEQVQDWMFPTDPMHVSFGLWDAAGKDIANAQWAGGPVNWEKYNRGVLFELRDLQIKCHTVS